MFTSTQLIIAQDFYVSDSNGSDNYSGTLEAPFKTINKGISMAVSYTHLTLPTICSV